MELMKLRIEAMALRNKQYMAIWDQVVLKGLRA